MLIQDQLAIAGGTSRAFRSYDTLNELMTNSGYNWAQVAAVYDECKLNAVTAKLIYMGTDAGALSQIIMSTAWDRSGITSGTFRGATRATRPRSLILDRLALTSRPSPLPALQPSSTNSN